MLHTTTAEDAADIQYCRRARSILEYLWLFYFYEVILEANDLC